MVEPTKLWEIYWMITKVKNALRRNQNDSESDKSINKEPIKVYVSHNGSVYVKGDELAQNTAWKAKVKELIDADLTGRNVLERDD